MTNVTSKKQARARQTQAAGCAPETPRPVIRGESQSEECAEKALIDWLGFTVKPPGGISPFWLRPFLRDVFGIPPEQWVLTNHGWSGYRHLVELGSFGRLGYGGDNQHGTVHVELNAHACAQALDWRIVKSWGEVNGARITRVDLAHDDPSGKVVNIDVVREWHAMGGFNSSGRPPTVRFIDDCGSGEGKTFYVGKRKNGKLVRCYEKGRQLGEPSSPWFRIEVELRDKHRVIPWDVLTRPGCYFAGAYPCLEKLGDTPERIRTIQRALKISYDKMERWVRSAAGPALNVMCEAHEGDAVAVLERVVRNRVPKRLQGFPATERRRVRDHEA